MSQHARKKNIDVVDVKLGCLMVRERSWARPPGRLLLSQLAGSKNKVALPVPAVKLGVRLPPDRFSLTAPNFRSLQAQHCPALPSLCSLCFRLRKRRKGPALVKNCSLISSPAQSLPEENLEPEVVEPPVFTIQFDLNQNNGFNFANFFEQN